MQFGLATLILAKQAHSKGISLSFYLTNTTVTNAVGDSIAYLQLPSKIFELYFVFYLIYLIL